MGGFIADGWLHSGWVASQWMGDFIVDGWTTWVRDRSRSADGECGAICSSIHCTLLARSFYCCSALLCTDGPNRTNSNIIEQNEMK